MNRAEAVAAMAMALVIFCFNRYNSASGTGQMMLANYKLILQGHIF